MILVYATEAYKDGPYHIKSAEMGYLKLIYLGAKTFKEKIFFLPTSLLRCLVEYSNLI